MRDDFAPAVKTTLAKRVANRCSNPDCGKVTSGPHTDVAKSVNIGVAAHITAAAEGGARYDPALSKDQRAGIENAIWLCGTCAALVDRDEDRYTVEVLRGWKAEAEERARRAVERLQADIAAHLDPAEVRKRDLRQLTALLHCIDLNQFDQFLERLRYQIVTDAIWNHFYSFDGTVRSTLFHLYDEELRRLVLDLNEAWNASLDFGDWFTDRPDGSYRFMAQHEGNDPTKWPAAVEAFDATVPKTEAAYRALVDFVRVKYPEIDLNETSEAARRLSIEEEERAERSFDRS